ncbi:MAG: AhpC/TSA family protein [Prolixibacteraceae bacterium]|nr:AhpC/TSA family protein [Prolixibacteraceae bacterium]
MSKIRFILFLVIALLIVNGCKKSNQFTITGKITHAEGDTIYLEEFSSSTVVDQAQIDDNGKFKLAGVVSIPTFYILKLAKKNIVLLLDSTENVVVEADAANYGREYFIEGSLGSEQIKMLSQKLAETEHKLDSLETLKDINAGNPSFELMQKEWDEVKVKIINEQSEFSKKFILDHPFSMASVYALYQRYSTNGSYVMNDFQTMRTAASALNAVYPNSAIVKALYENATQLLQQKRIDEAQKIINEQGVNSPEIVLPDINGDEIALSSLRGKVVLLQFWAAEDQNSRRMNSLLTDAYNKYKNRGFEIYQVNVGKNRSEWIDVTDVDHINWINVGDLEGSVKAVNLYNIQTIPSNYLLDKEGVILVKNISGTNLDRTLSQLLN